jgi:hypothetical protein
MRAILTISLVVLLALCAYLGSYFALVQRGGGECNLGFNFYEPAYRFCPRREFNPADALYKLAHMLDRRFLRPAMWVEKVDLVALLAAELARAGAVGAPNTEAGANGRQPLCSETNRTSAAAASRRSP